jgi:hypothetical protein
VTFDSDAAALIEGAGEHGRMPLARVSSQLSELRALGQWNVNTAEGGLNTIEFTQDRENDMLIVLKRKFE